MTISFRCEHCGKLLRAQGTAEEIRCDHCGKMAEVPAGLLSLPQVRLPAHVSAACTASAQGKGKRQPVAKPDEAEPSRPAAGGPALATVERVMPLVFSLVFHLSLVLVMVFLGTLVITHAPAEAGAIAVPAMGLAEGEQAPTVSLPPSLPPAPGERDTLSSPYQKVTPSHANMLLPGRPGGNGDAAPGERVIGAGPATGGRLRGTGLGIGDGPGEGGGSRLFPTVRLPRGPARVGQIPQNVVYVVDRSGSMVGSFDSVRDEMFKSIGMLEPNRQLFHVILFSEGQPLEPADRRLVPPTPQYIRAVTEFLRQTPAKGPTDPLPALARAFDVLDKVSGTKVIFLLTDSQFPDGGQVLQLLRQRNAKNDVRIYPILYGQRSKEAEDTMRKIAEENGHTTFRQINPEE
jgi:hypothetical protein